MTSGKIRFKLYDQVSIMEKRDEISSFLKGLGSEKRTLYGGYLEDAYPEKFDRILKYTIRLVAAFDENELIGLAGIRKNFGKGLRKYFPIVRAYTVVRESHQGRGIGSELSRIREDSMRNVLAFHLSIILQDNTPMIKIVKKSGYYFIKETGGYVYHIKSLNPFLLPLTPFVVVVYRALFLIRSILRNHIL